MPERITFDRSLYLPEAVEAAAAAYADHARIEITPAADATVATISDVREFDPQLIARAFCNHALYETIARQRQAAVDEAG